MRGEIERERRSASCRWSQCTRRVEFESLRKYAGRESEVHQRRFGECREDGKAQQTVLLDEIRHGVCLVGKYLVIVEKELRDAVWTVDEEKRRTSSLRCGSGSKHHYASIAESRREIRERIDRNIARCSANIEVVG